MLVLGNFSEDTVPLDGGDEIGADWADAELVLGNYPPVDGLGLTLRPWETRVYRR